MSSSTLDVRQSSVQEAVFFPASFAQRSLWLIDQLSPGKATYNIPNALRFRGKLEVEALQRTLKEIVRRHETLRTRFVVVGGEPQQVIENHVDIQLPLLDLTSIAGEKEREAEAVRLAREESQQPFNLKQAPLIRGKLLRLGASNHVLLFTMHHIVSDAWSTGVLVEEVSALYGAFSAGRPSPLPELPIQYADYSEWQREWLAGGQLEQQLGYWREQLAGVSVLQLPTDRPRPAARSESGATRDFVVTAHVGYQLKKLGEEQGATLFMVLLAAFQTLLCRYSGQEDIAVGTPIAGRRRSETEKLIGFFINTLVLRGDLSGAPSFTKLLQRTKQVTLGAYAHQDLPFQKLVEVLSPERNLGNTALFQVMLGLQNASQAELRLGAAVLQPFDVVDNGTAKFDLLLQHAEDGTGMLANSLQYSTDLFEAASIQRMIGHYGLLLSSIASAPHRPIHSLEMLSAEERSMLLHDCNATGAPIPEKTVASLFEEQAARTPDARAVRCGEEALSYRELDQRANQLGHHLKQMGVNPEMLVGICLNRSLDMVVALLGVLKSGGAYVPLDPSYPVERLGFMMEDAQIPVLVTESALLGSLPMSMVQIVSMDEDWKEISANSTERIEGSIDSSNLAYVIYTSGSTGQPKGVGVTHQGMVNYVNWAGEAYRMREGSGSPVHSSLAFDLTVTSIYPALLNGGWLEVLPQAAGMEELAQHLLVQQPEASEYGLVKLTPSHLRMLGLLLEKREKDGQGEREAGAGALVIGGEALRYADLEQWRKPGSRTRLINEYGPTETVVGSAIYEVQEEREAGDVPVGKPIANTGIYVLDANLEALPVGVTGELYIGGAGLARGYLNRPALTAERFVPNPYGEAGARMYRTGDLARWRGDGNLEYLGRNDQQVKIRGFRIELGEIEAMVESHAGVAQAVVLAREDQPGEKRLVAYVVKKAEAAMPGTGELTDYLKARLPEHMVPAVFVELEKWPLTHNGKIAREKLPQPGADRAQQEYVGPQNPTEETLCQVWQEVLHRERIGIHDNFFTLGGHSLLAVQASARMRESFKLDIPIRVLFELPTVAQMARHIAEAGSDGQPQATPIPVSARRQGATTPVFPASFAQRSLWFIDQLNPGKATYNIPNALRIRGELQLEVMKRTLEEIARRHETLRTRFVLVEGEPQQVVEERVEIQLPVLDLTSIAEENEREAEAVRLAREEAQQPFQLQEAPLLRGKLLRLDARNHVLLFTLHHIISDAWSAGVLAEEVSALYGAFSAGQPSPLPELPIQYADYSEWQRGWLEGGPLEEQLAYWKEQLAGVSMLQLPTDRPRPASRSESGATRGFVIGAEVVQPLKKLAEGQGATLFMVMLAAFQTLLYRYSRQEDIAVGTPNAGRGRSETEKLIGFFINTLVLRGDLSGGPSFTELLERTKKVTLGAYAHQDIPFQKLVEVLSPERNLGNTPLFQVMLGLQNAPQGDLRLGTATLEGFNNVDSGTAKFDLLLLHAEDGTGALMSSLEYSTDLFDADTISRMIGHYGLLLASIASAPQLPIHSLEILSAAERSMLLEDWNVTRAFPAEPTLTRWFEQQAARTPNATAVQCGEDSLSYLELNQRANQLAHYLRGKGVGPEVLVGICMERSLELVLGLLGILKAGGAYLPLDPHYPAERVSYMLEDAGVKVVVSQSSVQEVLPQHGAEVLLLDQGWEAIAKASVSNISDVESGATSENVAYVIYTSGSTGKPKGVLVTHGNVVRLMRATEGWFGFNPQDVWTMFHSYAFDFSVWELWGALLYGGRLEVVPYWVSRSPEAFYGLVKDRGVTVLNQTPSAFQQFSREDEAKSAEGLKLRLVIFGGEALEMSSLRPWFERHGDEIPQMVNMYGITETTVHVTYKVLTREAAQGKASVIGVRIPDLQMYILQEMEPVPVGVVGEMYVGGAGLARGYWSRAELTAQRFVPHPFSERAGERLYRTGDLGRYRADGGIEYLGRMDQQVKIRGHRIELGEIEAALEGHEGVKQAVVLVREDQPGEKRLVAYVVKGGGESEFDAGQMRSHLQTRLPDYMVPGALVVLEKMPLTAHGKLDRKALPRPEWGGDERKYVGPRNGVEEELSRIWSEVLGVERVGIQDNFFELGGDSIVSIRILARAREAGLKIELRQLFEQQTIERLAQVVTGVEVKEEREGEAARSGAPFSLISEADRGKLPEDVEDAYPVSRLQAGMLFHNEFNLETPLYYNISSFHLRAPFDGEVLRRAVEEVVRRHEVLRTSFHISGFSQPLQWVHRKAKIKITVDDLRHLSTEQQEEALKGWEEQEKRRRFAVSQPGLLRVHVHRRTEESLQFSLIEHHVILDGWSVASLLTELFGCYFGMLKGEWKKAKSLGSRFRDFVGAEMEVLESEEARRFWQQQLEGMEVATPPWEKQRSEKAAMAGLEVAIEEKTSEALSGWARQLGVPVKSVLLAAHVRVLSLITGQRDVITGFTSNGRMESRDAEQVLGLFLNSPPFRMQLPGGSWKELVQETARLELALLPYRRYPLADIQRLAGGAALFEVSFNFVHFHIYRELARMGSVEVLGGTAFAYTNFTLNADFTLDPVQSTLQLVLSYNASLVSKEQVETFGGYYQNALKAMVANPDGRYETTSLLSEEERTQVLYGWNSTAAEYPRESCLHELFEQQVAQRPDATAVVYGDQQLSYEDLNRRANQVAHYLRGLGIKPDGRVAICMERSLEMIVALLGVLKAGGAYVPLEPAYPSERLRYMLQDSAPSVLLIQGHLRERFSGIGESSVPVIDMTAAASAFSREPETNPGRSSVELTSKNLVYMIYTSGSTGSPKGVMIEHRSMANHIAWQSAAFGFTADDVVLQRTSISFDASVWEIWTALALGARLVLLPADAARNTAAIVQTINDNKVTIAQFVPSLLEATIQQALPFRCRYIFCGGEPLSPALLQQARSFAEHGVVNLYGPTEATIECTYWMHSDLTAPISVPIGKPIANARIYILDAYGQPAPRGVVGELHIGGAGLARGYLNQPGLTAERFAADPFSNEPDARIYKTGDLGRWLADGTIEFLGRNDFQVKIRGYRIELQEIDARLREHARIREAVVIARDDQPGEKRLVAYYTTLKTDGEKGDSPEGVSAEELRAHLAQTLPEYMIPAAYVLLAHLPLFPNGKLDRKALPAPERAAYATRGYAEPEGETEQVLAGMWVELLRVERVGRNDNFFELGGHSLLSLRLKTMVQQRFNCNLLLRDFFRFPTIAQMARLLEQTSQESSSQVEILIPLQSEGAGTPFFCVHPVGGQVVGYLDLANQLGLDRPFYGLQSPPAHESAPTEMSVEEMAQLYCQEVLRVQPEGPYLLGGWSIGGLIAFEMARQLKLSGKTVALLVLFDTYPPAGKGLNARSREEQGVSMLASFAGDLSRFLRKQWTGSAQEFLQLGPEQQWELLLETLVNDGLLPKDGADAALRDLLNVFTRNSVAADNYLPAPQEQSTILFQASENAIDPGYDAEKWTTWTGAPLDVHKIPGDHYTILRAPHVSMVADVLAKRMAQLSPNLKAIARSAGNAFTADEQAQPVFTMSAETRSS